MAKRKRETKEEKMPLDMDAQPVELDVFAIPKESEDDEETPDLPGTIKDACAAVAPEDALDDKQRMRPGDLTPAEKAELLERKRQAVRACALIAVKLMGKYGVRHEIVSVVKDWTKKPSAEEEKVIYDALMESDLVTTARKLPTAKQKEAGQQGDLVSVAQLGTPQRQIEYYTLKAALAEPASKAAAYLYSVAMAAARAIPKKKNQPSDTYHQQIVGTINSINSRI